MRPRHGFTLVELLVVITIIGILIALLLPAVQAAREAARRAQCLNHLKQISLAFLNHESAHRRFPAAGWGYYWTGDPDRGYKIDQPGGWSYNILPFIEQDSLHQLGLGQNETAKRQAASQVLQTPLEVYHCPTRRRPTVRPFGHTGDSAQAIRNANSFTRHSKLDYAANGGANCCPISSGPNDYAGADTHNWPSPQSCTGIMCPRVLYRMADIKDGASNTLMVGEKYLNADQYETGWCCGDDQGAYIGINSDDTRWSGAGSPQQDRPGVSAYNRFGSAHPGGWNAAFCDGSGHSLSYSIDRDVFRRLCDRRDREPIDLGGL